MGSRWKMGSPSDRQNPTRGNARFFCVMFITFYKTTVFPEPVVANDRFSSHTHENGATQTTTARALSSARTLCRMWRQAGTYHNKWPNFMTSTILTILYFLIISILHLNLQSQRSCQHVCFIKHSLRLPAKTYQLFLGHWWINMWSWIYEWSWKWLWISKMFKTTFPRQEHI